MIIACGIPRKEMARSNLMGQTQSMFLNHDLVMDKSKSKLKEEEEAHLLFN